MQGELTAEFRSIFAGKINLASDVEDLRARYASAAPFPHLVFDGLFAEGDLEALLSEMQSMRRDQWKAVDQDSRERTARMRSAADMGAAGSRLLGIVHSAGFLYLLSEITGIAQLLPDPYLQGAGYAQMRRGDYFGVHADRNVAYETGLFRRLAMIIFLNKSWSRDYHHCSTGPSCSRWLIRIFTACPRRWPARRIGCASRSSRITTPPRRRSRRP
jgi:hypothetical protein